MCECAHIGNAFFPIRTGDSMRCDVPGFESKLGGQRRDMFRKVMVSLYNMNLDLRAGNLISMMVMMLGSQVMVEGVMIRGRWYVVMVVDGGWWMFTL